MKNVFCITSTHSLGCTFFDWSIHFLSGQTHFFNYLQQEWIPLCQNPLGNDNAHNHKKNHPAGYNETRKVLLNFFNQSNNDLYSCYPTFLHFDVALTNLGINTADCENPAHWNRVLNYVREDFDSTFTFCDENNVKFIFVNVDPNYSLYFLNVRSLEKKQFDSGIPKDSSELQEDFQKAFFSTSVRRWKEFNLDSIWDHRERLALDMRPFEFKQNYLPNLTRPHLWLTSSELWFQGPTTIKRILNYLNLTLDTDRWHRWLPIYYKWQEIQLDFLAFDFKFDHIIESIIKNWYYNLGELSFYQEVAIQHALIYRHNLNLKTWQLEKFPSNTQDLHKLLESNIHPI